MKKLFYLIISFFIFLVIIFKISPKESIGIIDGALSQSCISENKIEEYISLGNENIKNTHGETVLKKIRNNINNDVYYVNVEESDNGGINIDKVTKALEILRNKKVKIINLSLAFNYEDKKLEIEIKKCIEDGIVIVASVDNSDIESYPACYDNVIAVAKEGSTIEKKELVKLNEESCNSYRTAQVTNYIVKNKLCNENIDKIIKKLNEKYN